MCLLCFILLQTHSCVTWPRIWVPFQKFTETTRHLLRPEKGITLPTWLDFTVFLTFALTLFTANGIFFFWLIPIFVILLIFPDLLIAFFGLEKFLTEAKLDGLLDSSRYHLLDANSFNCINPTVHGNDSQTSKTHSKLVKMSLDFFARKWENCIKLKVLNQTWNLLVVHHLAEGGGLHHRLISRQIRIAGQLDVNLVSFEIAVFIDKA